MGLQIADVRFPPITDNTSDIASGIALDKGIPTNGHAMPTGFHNAAGT
jgi:hypothetical protein